MICKSKDPLDNDIPDNRFFLRYGPGYELPISRTQIDDSNTENEMRTTYETILGKYSHMFLEKEIVQMTTSTIRISFQRI